MRRPGVAARLFMAVVAAVERLNLRFAVHGNPCVYDNAAFPWVAELERDWRLIRAEAERLLPRRAELANFADIAPDVGSISKDDRWKTFLLAAYGHRSQRALALCPETARAVARIPRLEAAMFSIFEPGQHLPPHRGPYNGVLRFHLGLIVPEPRQALGIRVGAELRHWREGQGLVFDDAYEHEAWNHTAEPRVVLFVDFEKPLRFPANLLNRLLLRLAVFTPFVREGYANQQAWERRFYGGPA
jgi:aspartyl/asparaginyl beta-hydroxylase (cupin superfamily)